MVSVIDESIETKQGQTPLKALPVPSYPSMVIEQTITTVNANISQRILT